MTRVLLSLALLAVAACSASDGAPDRDTQREPASDAEHGANDTAREMPGARDPGPSDPAGDPGEAEPDTAPPPPTEVLGLPLAMDGVLYAGAAAVDITPEVGPDKPVYLAGFGSRVAKGVHDPIWARALVLSRDREHVAIVALDLVGLTGYRAGLAAATLSEEGWAADRLIVHSTHNHAGPDTVGMWGPERWVSGLDPEYQERVVSGIVEAVRKAAGSARAAKVRVASRRVSDLSPYFTAEVLGGKGPGERMIGLVNDSRDPTVVDDSVTGIAVLGLDGAAIASIAHVNTHVEVAGGSDNLVTSDFAHPARLVLEERVGGVGILWAGAVGGLQTPLGVPLPVLDESGSVVFEGVDEQGDGVPVWLENERWARTDTYGAFVAHVAADALEEEGVTGDGFAITSELLHVPLENRFVEMLGRRLDTEKIDSLKPLVELLFPEHLPYLEELRKTFEATVLDYPQDWIASGESCPAAVAGLVSGCLPIRVWALSLGPLVIATAPGELAPELLRGAPPGAESEWQEAEPRGPEGVWFRQHDEGCDEVPWSECADAAEVGDCSCFKYHAVPYSLTEEDTPHLAEARPDAPLIVLGLCNEMGGYMVPEPDYIRVAAHPIDYLIGPGLKDLVAYASGAKDHYEESVSIGHSISTMWLHTARALVESLPGGRAPE